MTVGKAAGQFRGRSGQWTPAVAFDRPHARLGSRQNEADHRLGVRRSGQSERLGIEPNERLSQTTRPSIFGEKRGFDA